MERSGPGQRFERLRRAYHWAAIFVLNTLLLVVVLNLALYGVFAVRDAVRGPTYYKDWMRRYLGKLAEAYKDMPDKDLQDLVVETLNLAYGYETFTLFRDRPQRGRFVNVDENGYRHSIPQAPWPPTGESFNVFFFGGSTAFGWALPDGSTIASLFQGLVPRLGGKPTAVYNFSRQGYFSTQERILFQQLLLEGHRPDAAIFVDGLNDLHWRDGTPLYASRFAAALDEPQVELPDLPMLRLARSLRRRLWPERAKPTAPETSDRPEDFQAALARYLRNKAMIEASALTFDMVPIFVWQPVPSYKHEEHGYRFRGSPPWQLWSLDKYAPVYQQVEERARAGEYGARFLFCADVQQGVNATLYIDLVHYHPRLSALVAECIARAVEERGLLPVDEAGPQRVAGSGSGGG